MAVATAVAVTVATTRMAEAMVELVALMKTMTATVEGGGTDNNNQLKAAVEDKVAWTYY